MLRSCLPSVASTSPTKAFAVGCSNSDRRSLGDCPVPSWPSDRWHLDEMVVRIAGQHMYLWRAVDHEGEVLEIKRLWRELSHHAGSHRSRIGQITVPAGVQPHEAPFGMVKFIRRTAA